MLMKDTGLEHIRTQVTTFISLMMKALDWNIKMKNSTSDHSIWRRQTGVYKDLIFNHEYDENTKLECIRIPNG